MILRREHDNDNGLDAVRRVARDLVEQHAGTVELGKTLRRDAARVQGLTPAQRRLLVEATAWLALMRVAKATLPYRRLASMLRLERSDTCDVPPEVAADQRVGAVPDEGVGAVPDEGVTADARSAEAVEWALRAVSDRMPWPSTCLVQSLAGSALLRRRDLPCVVYLGVARDAGGEFVAHSWLRCGKRIVTGAAGHERYAVITAYRPAPDPFSLRRPPRWRRRC